MKDSTGVVRSINCMLCLKCVFILNIIREMVEAKEKMELLHQQRVQATGSSDLVLLREIHGLMIGLFVDTPLGIAGTPKYYKM